jgi:hypothetical protein
MLRPRFTFVSILVLGLAAQRIGVAADSPEEARLRAELRRQIAASDSDVPADFPTVPQPSHPGVAAPAPLEESSGHATMTTVHANKVESPAGAQREAELQVKKETQAAEDREAKAQSDLEAAKQAGKAPASAYATPKVVDVPKSFAGKEAELQELLILYKADQISSGEYHKKRAAIIARP